MTSKFHRGDWSHDSLSTSPAPTPFIDGEAIAALAVGAIGLLNRDDLIRVIREGHLPLVDGRTLRRLPFLDRASLERLAHLSRRCCQTRRTQMATACAAAPR
jgi:hypothetical protein